MHRIALVLFALVLFTAPLTAQTVTFTSQPYPEGLQSTLADNLKLDILITVAGSGESMTMSKESRKKLRKTVLETSGDRVQKVALEISEAYEAESSPMRRPKTKNYDMEDKVFILERISTEASSPEGSDSADDNPEWTVSRENGDAVTAEEREYILGEIVKKNDQGFRRLLDGRSMSVGDTLVLNEDVLSLLGGAAMPNGMSLKRAILILTGLGEEDGEATGLFDMQLEMLGESPLMNMTMLLEGKVVAFVETLWPLSLTLGGDIIGEGGHAGMDIAGEGMFEGVMKAE